MIMGIMRNSAAVLALRPELLREADAQHRAALHGGLTGLLAHLDDSYIRITREKHEGASTGTSEGADAYA